MLAPSAVARCCQVSRHVVRSWRLQGLLRAHRIPGSREFRYRQDEVVAMCKKHDWPINLSLLNEEFQTKK